VLRGRIQVWKLYLTARFANIFEQVSYIWNLSPSDVQEKEKKKKSSKEQLLSNVFPLSDYFIILRDLDW
jgi:hypothetical protein